MCWMPVWGLRSIIRLPRRSRVIRSFDPESLNWCSSSRSEYSGLFMTAMAPIFNVA